MGSDTYRRMGHFLLAILVVSSYLYSPTAQSNFVLPDIEPTFYDLFFSPEFYFNESYFSGHVRIYIKVNNNASRTVSIDSKSLVIHEWKVRNSSGNAITGTKLNQTAEIDRLVFKTVEPLPDRILLELSFSRYSMTVLPDNTAPSGFYKIPYVNNLSGKQSWLLVSDFRPGLTSLAFPCFDDTQFKAKFRITIRHNKGFTALSNMPVESVADVAGKWHDSMFKISPKMGSHQIRITISEFGFKNTTINETEYRVWARPDRLNEVDYALNVTSTIQQYLLQELGKPYSLEKLDQFAAPGDLPAAIDDREQWGLATYRESRLLFNETQKVDGIKHDGLRLIARTVVHPFFEPLSFSRSNPQNHIWLKEGLQLFYKLKALRVVDPTSYYSNLYYWEEQALLKDGTEKSEALVGSSFSTAKSDKGSAILRMVESFVGADTFRHAISRFLRDNANASVVTRHLWNAIQQEVGVSLDIRKIMSRWIFGKGFPVVNVQLLSGNVINATQKPFVNFSGVDPDNRTMWYIPLTYRTKSGPSGLLWMNESDAVFNITMRSSQDWIAFNYEGSGYYRVNYDTNLWSRLANQLVENYTVFSERARSKLLSDAVILANNQQLDFVTLLNLTKYASRETELTPWIHIDSGIFHIRIGLIHTTLASRFESYVLNLTSPLTDVFLVKREENHIEKDLRERILSLSCDAGHRGCIESWYRAFKVWIQTKTHVVAAENRQEVYCNAMANSVNESDWNTTFQRYLVEASLSERKLLIQVLCCSRNLTILERILDYSIRRANPDVVELSYIMVHVSSNPSSGSCVWIWYKRNYAEIERVFNSDISKAFVFAAAVHLKTREQYQELLDFYAGHTYFPENVKNALKNAIGSNIRWMDRNFNAIANWLEQNSNFE